MKLEINYEYYELENTLQTLMKEKSGEEYAMISIDDFLKMTTNDVIYEDVEVKYSSCYSHKLCYNVTRKGNRHRVVDQV